MMRGWIMVALMALVGCVEEHHYFYPDQDGGLEASTDAESDAAEDADPPDDAAPDVVEPCEVTYYRDADGDGYGDPNDSVDVPCHLAPPEGYTDNGDDCYDSNALAKPGQTAWFTVHRGDGSFDYNCDDAEALQRTAMLHSPKWCIGDVPQGEMPGWHISCPYPDQTNTYCLVELHPPGCGASAMWRTTCGYGEWTPQGCR